MYKTSRINEGDRAFVNEHEVPDSQLRIVYDEIAKKEKVEIEKYRKALHNKG